MNSKDLWESMSTRDRWAWYAGDVSLSGPDGLFEYVTKKERAYLCKMLDEWIATGEGTEFSS